MALIVLSARRVPLSEKARWYLDKGVGVVWLLPKEREVSSSPARTRAAAAWASACRPTPAAGPAPRVDELFAQIAAG